jgi:hypothetical protein
MSTRKSVLMTAVVVAIVGVAAFYVVGLRQRPITVDYPLEGSVFPIDVAPPTFEWRDASHSARTWAIDVSAGDGTAAAVHATSQGEPPQIGEIDPGGIGPTNELPKLTPEQAQAHTWKPDAATWETIKNASTGKPAIITITGYAGAPLRRVVSRGRVTIETSTDPVAAPILYRDVPLRPSAGERGLIQPLDKKLMPLIAWRLRNVSEPSSRVVMKGLHSCTNCHSIYSQTGRMADAAETTKRALDVALQSGDQLLADNLRLRLSSYEAGDTGDR